MTLPALLVTLVLLGYPLVYSFWVSLHQVTLGSPNWRFVGIDNYVSILRDPLFWPSMGRTLTFALITTVFTTVVGLAAALLLTDNFRGRSLFRALLILPWALSQTMLALTFGWIFNSTFGPLNGLLFDLGVIDDYIAWFASGQAVLNIIAAGIVWSLTPFAALLFLGALQTVPEELERAARVDGAGPVRRFLLVKVPWIRETVLIVVIISALNGFLTFSPIYILTGGGPGTDTYLLSWWGYRVGFLDLDLGRSAAIFYVMTLLVAILALVTVFALGQAARSVTTAAALEGARANARARSRRARARTIRSVVRALLLFVFLIWILAPFYFLLLVSFQSKADSLSTPPNWFPMPDFGNYARILTRAFSNLPISGPPDLILPGIRNSAIVASLTGILNVALGALAGYAFARLRFPGSRFIPTALLASQMVPAFALLIPYYVVLRQLGVTNTLQGIVIAELSITLPFSIWLLRAYFLGIPIALERAARVDGCNRLQTFFIVVLPLALPGLIAVGLFAFMVAWNDFLFAIVLNSRTDAMLIQPAIAGLYNVREQSFGIMAAGSMLAALPTLVLVLFLQRFLVRGTLSGATKG